MDSSVRLELLHIALTDLCRSIHNNSPITALSCGRMSLPLYLTHDFLSCSYATNSMASKGRSLSMNDPIASKQALYSLCPQNGLHSICCPSCEFPCTPPLLFLQRACLCIDIMLTVDWVCTHLWAFNTGGTSCTRETQVIRALQEVLLHMSSCELACMHVWVGL